MSLGTKISRLGRIREDLAKALKSLDRWKRDMEEKNVLGSFSDVYLFVRDSIRSTGTQDMELFRSEDLIEPLWREIAADRTKPIDLYERFSDSISFHRQRVATAERTISELREKLTQELANSGISQNDYPGLPFRNDLRFFSELVRILGTTYSSEEHIKKHYEELLESQRENYRSALHKSGDVLTKWKNYIDDFCSVMNRELRDIGGSDVSSISVTLRRTPLGTEMEALFDRLKETYAHVANQLSLDLDSGNFLTEPEENDRFGRFRNSLSAFIANTGSSGSPTCSLCSSATTGQSAERTFSSGTRRATETPLSPGSSPRLPRFGRSRGTGAAAGTGFPSAEATPSSPSPWTISTAWTTDR